MFNYRQRLHDCVGWKKPSNADGGKFWNLSFALLVVVQLCLTLGPAACQASLTFTISLSLLRLMSIEWMMPSNYLILCHLLFLLPSVFPSIRVFSNESVLHIRWPKYWSFSFSISPFNEYSGLISFRTDWFDLVVQKTLKSSPAPWFESINFLALSLLYGSTVKSIHDYWKNHSSDYIQIFVGKVMSLLFNMLSRFVIAFLPNIKCLLILWLQLPFAVILRPKKRKFVTVSTFSPSIYHDGTRYHDLCFFELGFKPAISLSSFTLIKRLFSYSSLSLLQIFEKSEIFILHYCKWKPRLQVWSPV